MGNQALFFPYHKVLWQGVRIVVFMFSVITSSVGLLKAQSGNVDMTFNANDGSGRSLSGFNIDPNNGTGWVRKILIQPDGKIVVGGSFQNFAGTIQQAGVRAGRIARLNPDGLNDISFNTGNGFTTGFNFVSAMVLQPDGKIVVGGNLFSYGNVTGLSNMLRLNADGTRDQSFVAPSALFGTTEFSAIYALALQADGKLIVGGGFRDAATPTTVSRIIRLNANGTRDNTFVTSSGITNTGPFAGNSVLNNAFVYAIVIQPDGKIILGGDFSNYGGTDSRKIVRLNADGTRDATFNIGTGFDTPDKVYSLALQADGKVLVGGNLTNFNGISANHIIRLNANGSRDASFNIGTAFNNPVRDIKIQADGKILVGGAFTSFNNTAINRLIRLNIDGTRDVSFNVGTGASHEVYTIAIQPDDKIIVGGDFFNFNGIVRNGIARLGGVPTVATVALTGTLNPFTTCAGTPSATQTYTVSGTNLSANMAITAPAGIEISSNGGMSYSNTLNLTATNGAVPNTTITVRVAANATATPSGNITHTSGTITQNIATTGTLNPLPTITLGVIPAVTTTATSVSIPYTAITGSPNQYSITTGTNALANFVAVNNQNITASPIVVPLPTTKVAGTYNFNLTVRNSTTGCVSAVVPFSMTIGTPPPPVITITGTLNPLSACAGQTFIAQTYTISGTNLTENIIITAPTGIEVSADAGINYSNSLALSPMVGALANTTIRVRLSANATGSPSGNITHTSGTVTQNLAVSGVVSVLPTITIGNIPSINTRSTSFTIPYTATTGSPNQFSLTVGNNALPNFVAINNQTLTTSPLVIPIPQNSVVGNYNFNLIVRNSTTGCESLVIPIILNNVMSVADEEFSQKVNVYPNPTEGAMTVQFPNYSKIEALRLLNALGQEILSLGKQTSSQVQLDLTAYSAGVYYLYIIEEKKVGIKRISITK